MSGSVPELKFVGWCQTCIKDSDGHIRQVKGNNCITSVHTSTNKDGSVIFKANFVEDHPLEYVALNNEENVYLSVAVWFGSSHYGHSFFDNVVARSVPKLCGDAIKELDKNANKDM
jgi:hypothetical protein